MANVPSRQATPVHHPRGAHGTPAPKQAAKPQEESGHEPEARAGDAQQQCRLITQSVKQARAGDSQQQCRLITQSVKQARAGGAQQQCRLITHSTSQAKSHGVQREAEKCGLVCKGEQMSSRNQRAAEIPSGRYSEWWEW